MRCGSTRTTQQRDEFAGELLRPLLATSYAATSLAAYGEAEWPLSTTCR